MGDPGAGLDAPELRQDPLSGRRVVIAPGRAWRPGAPRAGEEEERAEGRAACPFCEGHEGETPPETLAIGEPGRAANTPGWCVRVVPNKFPAFEHHEVVVHTPHHVRSLADLSEQSFAHIARAWAARAGMARAEGFVYVQALINEGRAAGASRAHTHSQLVWLHEEPPLAAQERSGGGCRLCQLVSQEMETDLRIVADWGDLLLFCPPASRSPYEMMVTPHAEHTPDAFADEELLSRALALAADGLRRLHAAEGLSPLNAWLHTAPFGEDAHWHLEVVPRLTVLAALELGAGYYVNTVAPERAAAILRDA